MRGIDPVAKLRHLLQVLAFCLAIATIQYAFLPERGYGAQLVYSLCVGLITWACVDFPRHLLPSSAETGWPKGLAGVALVATAIAIGYFAGTALGDILCRTLGLHTGPRPDPVVLARQSVLITALAGIAGSYYFYNAGRRSHLERRMGEVQRHANEARLKLLETQLEPHMLFNTLANLRALIALDPPRAQQMLDHMIAYLRATLDASRATTHALQFEFDRLRDYLALMAIRMGPRLSYELVLPPELAAQAVPPLLLQPIVENSIRHGLEPQVRGGRIEVRASRESAWLVLEVSDSGVGQTEAAQGAAGGPDGGSGGFGLAQVRERLATQYGESARYEFESAPGMGARTRITLPLSA
ncbi:sensor histidine kinase [Hylemonella gracilis]|uniref:histidine kinase n=1 Tax=Hylemonella gracilis ATCC 19624 TaxID=887062 RepID=F3KXQ3_9BURK|nr:histidine kinase [Hylemonella gracilis]EGI75328.1 histidine kinase internal region protein [Hylemonella gracilis ATCC 19624]